jgi:hypothetical protein
MAISDMMSNASRWVYSASEGKERQLRLQLWNQVKSSPYFNEGMSDYIANLTKPENQTWGKTGNVMAPFLSGTPEDIGTYNNIRETTSSKSLNIADALSYLKTERGELLNTAATSLYNSFAQTYVLPASRTLTTIGKAISGTYTKKSMSDMPFFEGLSFSDKVDAINVFADSPAKIKSYERSTFAPMVGLNETGDFYKGDLEQRASRALSYYTATDSALLGELGLYELAKMTQANYTEQSMSAMKWAREKLSENAVDENGKKLKGKKALNYADAQLVSGGYAEAFASGGFTGLMSLMYSNKAITEKEYLDYMAKVINETKHKEISKYYPDVKQEDEVTAKTKTVEKGGVSKTVIELQMTIDGKPQTPVEITPEELASLQIRL